MKKFLFLALILLSFSCTSDDVTTPEEVNYCELEETNCYAVRAGVNYEPTGEEPEVLLPEGTNIYSGDFVFCSLPHGTVFFSAGYYFRVDCRYE
ncbi:MAG: hypothetical protein PQJ49_04375 [Sphaerochaetaceae bacterium]|nr:hypothetical protein [Sphaerochaetaceae bacterium]